MAVTTSDHVSELHTKIALRDVDVSRVLPSSVSKHPDVVLPSLWDLLALDLYVPGVVFYRLDDADPSHFSHFINAVKTSLSKAVSVVYPMAGKWVISEDAWIRKLICNDEGPVFVEASIDEDMDKVVDFDQFKFVQALLGDAALPGYNPQEAYQKLEKNEYPSLALQVTRFKCGGVALSFNYNHLTVDGFGFDRFLKIWSDILATGETSESMCFDRSLAVSHFDCSAWLGITPDMSNVDDQLGEKLKRRPPVSNAADCAIRFSIRMEVVEFLQKKAREDDTTRTYYSKFSCIMATLWRCLARVISSAEGWSCEDYAVVIPVIEGRKRWSKPQIPENYCGNLMFWNTLPLLTSSELDSQPHAFAARKVHECVDELDHEKTTAAKLPERFMPYAAPKEEKRIFQPVITSWLRFQNYYELDFGYGKPFCFQPNLPSRTAPVDYGVLYPGPPGSNVFAGMELHFTSEVMKVLLEDREFQQLVS